MSQKVKLLKTISSPSFGLKKGNIVEVVRQYPNQDGEFRGAILVKSNRQAEVMLWRCEYEVVLDESKTNG